MTLDKSLQIRRGSVKSRNVFAPFRTHRQVEGNRALG